MKSLNYRRDIDGLRAIAVACVVIYHAFPALLPSGFVGVDVFFVISGYLITSIIVRGLEDKTFSFAEFYARRVKRIFPALIIVLLFSYAVGWQLLLPEEFKQLGKQIVAGAGFASNFILYKEVGYFDTNADLKPLLHLWSLGIEEQFYILWPLLIVAAYRLRIRLSILVAVIASVSFVVNVILVRHNAAGGFYLPHSRAWQLASGAILASFSARPSQRVSNWLSIAGIIGLVIAATCIGGAAIYPGWWAVIPTVAAVALIAAGPDAAINRTVLSSSPFVWIGLVSFPLYLWHWPLLAFSRLAISGTPSIVVRCALVFSSLALAWLTYRFVEMPVRRGNQQRPKVIALCAVMALTAYTGINAYSHDGLSSRAVARTDQSVIASLKWDYWTSPECVKAYATEPCEISAQRPETMLLGDSHANHLYPGLVRASQDLKVMNVGTCWPLDDVIMGIEKNQQAWPCTKRDSFTFDRKILEDNPSVETVIISGWWEPVLDGAMDSQSFRDQWGSYSLVSNLGSEAGLDRSELMFRGFSRTINYLESKKLNVIFVLDTPFIYADLNQYCALGNRFRMQSDCSIPRLAFEKSRAKEMSVVNRLKAAHPKLVVFDPLPLFCDAKSCYLVHRGTVLFRDQTHLSVAGSDLVATQLAPLVKSLNESRRAN